MRGQQFEELIQQLAKMASEARIDMPLPNTTAGAPGSGKAKKAAKQATKSSKQTKLTDKKPWMNDWIQSQIVQQSQA